ncbi:hypothetical protein [Caudoviricetes sp.]|nr:hypothetical protein [Caudoviricetes sp.]
MEPKIYTYRFDTYWTTTSEELTGYIDRFEVQPEDVSLIEQGEMPNEVLHINDPILIE